MRQGCGFAYGIRLIPIEELLEHEEVIEDHVQLLIKLILKDGMLHYPILVEIRHKVILDGHHRFNALKRLGAAYVPALLINYSSPAIKVLSWRPEVKVTVWRDGEIDVTIDVFHFLTAFLERDKVAERLEDMLYNMADKPEYENWPWLAIMEEFMEFMGDLGWEVQGIANTYNWENLLSQVLQYGIIYNRETDEYYIILQIHNGCDVRGGYTKPRIFRLLDYDYFHMAMTDIYVSCRCTWGYSDFQFSF